MAKGYSARRGFSNGSGQMLKQQQMQQQIMKMQEDMQKAQQEVEEKTFSASVGGGGCGDASGSHHLRRERSAPPGRRGDGREDERADERTRPQRVWVLIFPFQAKTKPASRAGVFRTVRKRAIKGVFSFRREYPL